VGAASAVGAASVAKVRTRLMRVMFMDSFLGISV
jgi:hypothetical protein